MKKNSHPNFYFCSIDEDKKSISVKEIREFLFENLLIYKFFTFENYHKDNNKKDTTNNNSTNNTDNNT